MGSEIKSLEHPTLKVSRSLDYNVEMAENQAVSSVEIKLFFVLKFFTDKRNFYRFPLNDKIFMTGSLTSTLISSTLLRFHMRFSTKSSVRHKRH